MDSRPLPDLPSHAFVSLPIINNVLVFINLSICVTSVVRLRRWPFSQQLHYTASVLVQKVVRRTPILNLECRSLIIYYKDTVWYFVYGILPPGMKMKMGLGW